ncbi:MAG TPA: hypothetical protein VGI96_28365 [Streptosporangiaceae bacterium]
MRTDSAIGADLAARRPANPITLCDSHDSDFVTVAGQILILMAVHRGKGTVQRYDGDQVTVLFDEHGYRELSCWSCRQRSNFKFRRQS